jgi:hypothetical protein
MIGAQNSNVVKTTPRTALILQNGNDSGLPLDLIEIFPRRSRLHREFQNSCSGMGWIAAAPASLMPFSAVNAY